MTAVERYTVMTTGTVEPGFDEDQVAADFVDLLHLTPAMAISFVSSKQCVAADLDESRAMAYQQSLSKIGLPVVLVPSDQLDAVSANDNHHALDDFEKPFDPQSIEQSSDELAEDLRLQPAEPRKNNRTYRLAILGVIVALLAGVITLTKAPSVASAKFVTQKTYTPEAKASEQIQKLLAVSGANDDFTSFTNVIKIAHTEYFSQLRKQSPTLTDEKYNILMELVPRAYNDVALKNVMGNRLQQLTFESDVIGLIKLFETPSLRQYISLTKERNPMSDPEGYEGFKTALKASPLSSQRRDLIALFIDTLGLDDAAFEIAADLQRNLIANAGELRPDKNTTAAKESVRDEIKLMRAAILPSKPAIRDEAITTLAWQYEGVNIEELAALREKMGGYLIRNHIRELSAGYESYLLKSTTWLHGQLDD